MTSYLDIVVSEVFGCVVSVFPEDVVSHDDCGEDWKALGSVEGTVVVVRVNPGQLHLVTRLKQDINSLTPGSQRLLLEWGKNLKNISSTGNMYKKTLC